MTPASPIRREPTLRIGIFLIALSATAPISVDMFLPSMPDITEEFNSSEAVLTLGVTLFLVSFAGSQLFYGPASDRWGRRPILFLGLALYSLGGIVCVSATSAEQLILGRILQGLGGGVGPALANAMVLDIYGREGAAKMIGYMAIVLPLAPAIAPILGGGIAALAGWRAVFVALTGLGVLFVAWYVTTLGETRPPREGVRPGLLGDYRTLFGSATFMGYAMVMGLMFAGQLLFISTSSFVLIDRLGLSPTVFGIAFGSVALGFMAGAAISSRLVTRLPGYRIVMLGAALTTASTGVMLVLVLAGARDPFVVMVPTLVSAMGMGIARPSAMAGALVPFPQMAGLASSTMVFSQMALSSGYNVVYSTLVEPGVVALAVGMFVPVALGLLASTIVRPRANARQREPEGAAAG